MHYLDAGILSIPDNISDHKATYVILPFQYNLQGSFTRLVWLYKKANFDLLKEKLSNYDWSVLHEGSLDDACSKFTDIFLDMVKLCIPSNLVVVRPNDKPWYDSEIRHFTTKRDKLKRKFINLTSLHLRGQYRKLRNKVNNLKKSMQKKDSTIILSLLSVIFTVITKDNFGVSFDILSRIIVVPVQYPLSKYFHQMIRMIIVIQTWKRLNA